MAKKNTWVITLMCSSMALLLLLQFFWIKGAYENAAEDFRKETNALFRNTIFTMHDSLIQRSIVPVGPDSLHPKMIFRRKATRANETITVRESIKDSMSSYINVTEKSARIEIFSNDKSDSLGKILRPLITRMEMGKEPKSFVFRISADSLDRDSIKLNFERALQEAGIDAEFTVVKVKPRRPFSTDTGLPVRDKFISDNVPFSPMTQYAVRFAETPSLLWKEIAPQISFAVFLTLLTSVSFVAMFRNMRAQQRLMEIKNDFISNVSHELKTPVATVSVALEALKNFSALDDPQKTKEYLDIAQRELNRLTLMTDKILKTSVYEDQGVTLKLEPIHLDHLIDQVLSSMKLVFEKKRTHLQFEKTGSDFSLDGSQEHLTNVFYNLVDNALKYSGENSRLELSLERLSTDILIKVKDNGIGIPKEYQKRIFEKFFRVPSGDVHNTKGYGLGLSYVASVIESHQGEISVESEPGKGSCFIIRLPREQK